jgi:hypothetical protein
VPRCQGLCGSPVRDLRSTSAGGRLGVSERADSVRPRPQRCLCWAPSVNGLVGHAHALVIGILDFQPSGNLLRRPVQDQFTHNDLLHLHVDGKKARLGSQGRLPGLVIGFIGSIERSPAMARHLSAHGRHSSLQMFGYLTNRPTEACAHAILPQPQ